MIKWLKTYVLSLRRDFVILLGLDVLLLLVMELWLRNIPAPYPVFVRIGDLFVTLGVSFIASFVFYFVQVHMTKVRDKESLYPSIAQLFNSIISAETDILTQLLGLKMKEMSEEAIKEKAKQVDLYAEAPLIMGGPDGDHKANWLEYCIYRVRLIDRNVDMLLNMSAYLDSDLMAIILRIEKFDTFLDRVRYLFPMCSGNAHRLTFQTPGPFIELWHFIKKQEAYYDRELSKYFARNWAVVG